MTSITYPTITAPSLCTENLALTSTMTIQAVLTTGSNNYGFSNVIGNFPLTAALVIPTTCTSGNGTALTATGYPTTVNYYIGDTLSIPAILAPFTACTGCSYSGSLSTEAASDLTLAFVSATSVSTFSTPTITRDGTSLNFYIVGTAPTGSSSPCGEYFLQTIINILNPLIVHTAIANITYLLNSAVMYIQFTPFTNNKGITGDPKIAITYVL